MPRKRATTSPSSSSAYKLEPAFRVEQIGAELTPAEREVVNNLKAAGAYGSDAELVRDALWTKAHFMGVAMPAGTFSEFKRRRK